MARQVTSRAPRDDKQVSGQVGNHLLVDWPRSIGFFGALGAAVALDLVPIPIAFFVASVPFLKLLNRPHASTGRTFVSHLVDGAAKPVGGDSEGTIRWDDSRPTGQSRTGNRRPTRRRR
ncbi:MAG TPA: hypothetical protein VFR33_14495 [Candidatus Dormibacteraeota bacterium]|nr:hypothetical protein [Candidatus Dormibacteraeota bacterium]